jgi:NitT/TauT family transport system substrate-binding protein
MRRKILALSAVPLLVVAACGGDSDDADDTASGTGGGNGNGEVTDVSVGVIPIIDVAPIYVGQEQGFFEECGLNLTLETAQGGAAIVPGVVSGEFQFGFSNITSLLVAAAEGLPLVGVANGVASTGDPETDFGAVVVLPDSGIEDAADLAGTRIAVNTLNNIGTTTIRESIRAAGGDPEDVEFVELPFPEMPAALEQGNVDAVWVVEPFLTIATEAGAEPVAFNFVDAADELTVAMYFTSEQYAAENADAVECFSSAMAESLAYTQENPDAAREVLPSYTELDPEIIEQLRLPNWPAEVNRESVERLAELSVDDGLIDEVPDLDALLP